MNKMHIVVAEDDEPTLRGIQKILEDAGARVSTALNGQEALNIIVNNLHSPNPVTFLVFDIIMPEMSGIELVRALKERGIKLPALAVTGAVDTRVAEALKELGHEDYLEKPFNTSDLLDMIGKALR